MLFRPVAITDESPNHGSFIESQIFEITMILLQFCHLNNVNNVNFHEEVYNQGLLSVTVKKCFGFTVILHPCHAKHPWALDFNIALMTHEKTSRSFYL